MKKLTSDEFVVLDVETTGLYPQYGDRVIELAAIKFKGKKVVGRFEQLINPQTKVSYGAFVVNGISDDMLKDAPLMKDVWPKFEKFLGEACLIGHNVRFDLRFLNSECARIGANDLEQFEAIDTVKMSRALIPGLNRYSLTHISSFLGVLEDQQHRAMADVTMTFNSFQKMVEIAENNGIADKAILLNLFGIQKMTKQKKPEKMKLIKQALDLKQKLNFLYFGASSGPTVRDVTPQEIKGEGKEATLVGYCHRREEERLFKIDRIVQLN